MTVRYIAFQGALSFTPPLDVISGAFVGYSVARKLRAAYTGYAFRVRRSNDNAELDIAFDGSGNTDIASIASHCGANTGFIRKLYDQGGNGYDLIQDTNGDQPQIYNGSSVLLGELGKPVAVFAAGKFLDTGPSVFSFTSAMARFSVFEQTTWTIIRYVIDGYTDYLIQSGSSSKLVWGDPGQNILESAGGQDFGLNVGVLCTERIKNGEPAGLRKNNETEALGTLNVASHTCNGISLNARGDGSSSTATKFHEVLIFASDVLADIAAVQANINAYYSIW